MDASICPYVNIVVPQMLLPHFWVPRDKIGIAKKHYAVLMQDMVKKDGQVDCKPVPKQAERNGCC